MKTVLKLLSSLTLILSFNLSSFSQRQTFNSEVYYNSYEEYYPDSVITYTYNENSDSLRDTKVVYGWDQTGKITMYASYKWDTTLNYWKGAYRDDSEYDIKGNKLFHKSFVWDTSAGDWYFNRKIDYLYNDSDDLNQESQYLLDTDQITWNLLSRQDYEYAYGDHYTEYIVTSWNVGGQTDTTTKTELFYNPNSMLLLKRISLWQKGHGEWKYLNMDSMKYDDNNRMTEDSYYSWNSTNQQWDGTFKTEFKEYVNNNCSLLWYYSWVSSNESWNLEYREELKYNETGKQTLLIGSQWRSGIWINSLKRIIDYDNHDNDYMESWYRQDENAQNWFITGRLYYFYSYSGMVSTENAMLDLIHAYPSVVSEFLIVETNENHIMVDLYDINGRLVNTFHAIKGQNTISTASLKPGVYILKATLKGHEYSVKLLKK